MPTKYAQLIFAAIPTAAGVIEFRINTDGHTGFIPGIERDGSIYSTTGQFRLNDQLVITDTEIELDEQITSADGAVVSEQIEFTIQDKLTVSGYVGALLVVQDFSADFKTFVEFYFSDKTILYPFWATLYKDNGDREIFFSGDIDANQITVSHNYVHKSHTAEEQRIQTVKFKARSWAMRMKQKTVEQLIPLFVEADMTGPNSQPFFAGMVAQPYTENRSFVYDEFWVKGTDGFGFSAITSKLVDNADWDTLFDVAYYGHFGVTGNMFGTPEDYPATFPLGTWGVKVGTIIKKICDACDFDFDAADDLESSFVITLGNWNNTTKAYEHSPITVQDWELCYNYVFGISPYDGSAFTCPITFGESSTLASVLQSLSYLMGAFIWPEINQSTGYMRLRLFSWRHDSGPLPSNLIFAGESKQDVTEISAEAVAIKNKGNEGMLICPDVETKNLIEIEIPFRVKPMGRLGQPAFGMEYLTFDSKKSIGEQWLIVKRSADNDNHLNADGWIAASYVYAFRAATTNAHYPTNVTPTPLTDWDGYYMARAITETPGEYLLRENAYYAYAQFYARELLGNKRSVGRKYIGVLGDDGLIRSIRLNLSSTWNLDGALRVMRGAKIKRKFRANTTEITFRERPADYATYNDLSTRWKDATGNTSGGIGGATNSTTVNNTEVTVVGGTGNFALPFAATVNNAADLFSLTQTGAGRAGFFEIDNSSAAVSAMAIESNGLVSALAARNLASNADASKCGSVFFDTITGPVISGGSKTGRLISMVRLRDVGTYPTPPTVPAVEIIAGNDDDAQPTVRIETQGTSNALRMEQSNPTSTYEAFYGLNVGLGSAVKAEINNAANENACMVGVTNGLGAAVFGLNSGSGQGVFGQAEISDGVAGVSIQGTGVNGFSVTGIAGYFRRNSSSESITSDVAYIIQDHDDDIHSALTIINNGTAAGANGINLLVEGGYGIVALLGTSSAPAYYAEPDKGAGLHAARIADATASALLVLIDSGNAIHPTASISTQSTTMPALELDGQLREQMGFVGGGVIPLNRKYTFVDTATAPPTIVTLPPVVDCIGATYYVFDGTNNAATAGRNISVNAFAGDTFVIPAAPKIINANGAGVAFTGWDNGTVKLWQARTMAGV